MAAQFVLQDQAWFNTPGVLGITAVILVFVGWAATAFSIGIASTSAYANTESVNAVRSTSIGLHLTVGAVGFLGNLVIRLVARNRADFVPSAACKVFTT